jgi:hypothetical protein
VATGNISGGNLTTAGVVTATGNITTSSFFVGNGSQLTGLPASYGNADVANYLPTFTGNISGGNLSVTGIVSATGNVSGGNLTTAGQVTATGNVTGGNLLINNNAVITGNLQVLGTETILNTQTLTVNDLDIVVANNVTGGASINGAGLLAGNPTTASWIFNNATTSWQSNVGITPSANATLALGGPSNYFGTAYLAAALISGNVTGGNVNTAGLISATGNITGGNLITAGLVSLSSITKTGSNGVGNIGSTTSTFNTIFAKATSAQYADLAEVYAADAAYEPGTVMSFGGIRELTVSTEANDTRIAGVISTAPSYIMNSALESEHTATVALTGRVPTRVTGTVRKGDMMVSAGDGSARACSAPQIGTVIGKALEDFAGESGVIEVVVGRL